MATKKAPVAVAVPFKDLRGLVGLAEDDPKLLKVLATAGKVTWTKPDGGERYAVAKQAGFDLIVRRPDDAKRTAPKVVHTIFLYCQDSSGHAQYSDPTFGITFTTRAQVLAALPKPSRTWKIGKGAVPVTTKNPDHDEWVIEGLKVSVDYNDALAVCTILVSKSE